MDAGLAATHLISQYRQSLAGKPGSPPTAAGRHLACRRPGRRSIAPPTAMTSAPMARCGRKCSFGNTVLGKQRPGDGVAQHRLSDDVVSHDRDHHPTPSPPLPPVQPAQPMRGLGCRLVRSRLLVQERRLPGVAARRRARRPARQGLHLPPVCRSRRQPSRSAITPPTMTAVPMARCRPKRSFSSNTPSSAANSTEVSRRAATLATGARVMAHSAMP